MPQGEGHLGEGNWGEEHHGEGHRGQGHRGEGDVGEGHWADCPHMPIRRVAAAPHQHPRCFQLSHLLAELALLGKVYAALQCQKGPAQ